MKKYTVTIEGQKTKEFDTFQDATIFAFNKGVRIERGRNMLKLMSRSIFWKGFFTGSVTALIVIVIIKYFNL